MIILCRPGSKWIQPTHYAEETKAILSLCHLCSVINSKYAKHVFLIMITRIHKTIRALQICCHAAKIVSLWRTVDMCLANERYNIHMKNDYTCRIYNSFIPLWSVCLFMITYSYFLFECIHFTHMLMLNNVINV